VAFDRALRSERLEESEERRRHVLAAMLRAEEHAKAKLASDLHDDTIQVLAATLLSLDRVAGASRAGDMARVTDAAARARATLKEAIERTRLIMFDLRPRTLVEQGIGEAAKVLLEDAAGDGEFGWAVRADIGRYSTHVENLVYRALQEAVANVRKHAHATRVTVDLDERDGWLECAVRDDGRGFVVEEALDRNRMRLHLGLEAMRERIDTAGGELRLDSAPEMGTLVWFRVPLPAVADHDDAAAGAAAQRRRPAGPGATPD
jgi:signal transduction histidine kinase